jgi:hypothetical protein
MILHAYGCSWTAGEGTDRKIENTLSGSDKLKFQNENSWVKFLSDALNISSINNGVCGNSNNKIFNKIVTDVKSKKIGKEDLVIIMWSSSLRDTVPFLPTGEWVTWSVKHLIQEPHKFINSHKTEDEQYDSFFKSYKEFFIGELFNQNYYNIVSQNYIIFIQTLLKHYNIKYVMCDSFEKMVIDLNKKDDVMGNIDKSYYWNFNNKTFRDFLNEKKVLDIWEHQTEKFETTASQHPNRSGYQLISNELYNYIIKNKIMK